VSRFKAHDENNSCHLGDTVRIVETRPLSKEKRWMVADILTRGDVAETQPGELAEDMEREQESDKSSE
jgi:small subunit ribosomal protein S17